MANGSSDPASTSGRPLSRIQNAHACRSVCQIDACKLARTLLTRTLAFGWLFFHESISPRLALLLTQSILRLAYRQLALSIFHVACSSPPNSKTPVEVVLGPTVSLSRSGNVSLYMSPPLVLGQPASWLQPFHRGVKLLAHGQKNTIVRL